MPNPVAYFELGGRDAAGLSDLYANLFDWNVEQAGPSAVGTDFYYVEPSEGGIGGGIIQTDGEMPESYMMFYVSVDDIQGCLDKAESLGCVTVVPPMPIPNGMGHIAVFRDPQGNHIGLHKFQDARDA